jgi:hypothetical protein
MKRDVLTAPFSKKLVRTRPGQHGKTLNYIPTFAVIDRLNEGCETWDFFIDEYKLLEEEVVVLGRLVADGITKSAFGSSAITRNKDKTPVSLGDDLKAGTSDALKKAASLFGVGRELYAEKTPHSSATSSQQQAAPNQAAPSEATRGSSTRPFGGATVRQLAALNAASRNRGLNPKQFSELVQAEAGKTDISLLSREEASSLLDKLNNNQNGFRH